ncbi:MAG: phenylalanine--tRNA ligase subunit beta [Thermodesulfobacteriota bacterium]
MKFTIEWLRQYVDFDFTPQELADRLTMAGLEVDAVEEMALDLAAVKVAEIIATHPHPNADKLVLCDVKVGADEVRVVCGAPNARAGLLTAIALPGCRLPGGFKIKKSKIRGEASFGMLCSAKELNISEESAGILELNDLSGVESGQDLRAALGLNDILIEVDLTPNRPDCASVIGTAREVAAMAGTSLKSPVKGEELPELTGSSAFRVEVAAPDLCPRYVARRMTNVTVAPSPWWLQKRLLSVGLRPINNVVDATNFVMLEYGQPLHAFDFAKLGDQKIVVRTAEANEKITTLDGQERELAADMLLICDGQGPVAVAGVMGGGNSEVDSETTELLLESACFAPVSVRRTSRNLNLSTDASYRFERGVDPQLAPLAMARLVDLLTEISGGRVDDDGIDALAAEITPRELKLRVKRTNDLLGTSFTTADISAFLTSIEMVVKEIDDDTLLVTVPTFRVDIEREVDLVEEVARMHGYNEVGTTLPVVPMSFAEQDPARALRQEVKSHLLGQGCFEAINYSFTTPEHDDLLGLAEDDPNRQYVTLLNPLTEEQSVMRRSLLPGLLENVRRNVNFQANAVRLFEIGKSFAPQGAGVQPHEENHLCVVISGRRFASAPDLHFGQESVDFYDIKGVALSLLADLRCDQVALRPGGDLPVYVDPGQALELVVEQGEEVVGCLAKVSASCLRGFAIKQDVYFLDLNFDRLVSLAKGAKQFKSLPKFPAVQRDIAILVPEATPAGELVNTLAVAKEKLLEQVSLFDVYQGKNIDEGFKSVAISVTYRSTEKTLDDKVVNKVHQKMIDLLLSRYEGRLREV